MKKQITTLLTIATLITCAPVQSDASSLYSKVTDAVSRVSAKVDAAFSKVKDKTCDIASNVADKTKSVVSNVKEKASNASEKVGSATTKAKEATVAKAKSVKESASSVASTVKEKASNVKNSVSSAFSSALGKARSVLQNSFNMNFLSSVPVVFWKKSFDRMFTYAQDSVDNMTKEYNGELITRDDFQDDKALHIKKSAELALHIKSLFGSSIFAYGVTLAVGGIKELIDSSFLNPNGGRCWEDFYADIVGASAVFGEKAFDKKLNKYMDSFLKENRKVDMVDSVGGIATVTANINVANSVEPEASIEVEGDAEYDDVVVDQAVERQRLTEEYYKAIQNNDAEAIKEIAEKLKSLK